MTQRLDMLTQHELQRRLPEGWETPTERKQQALQTEFLLERPQDHPLHGMELRVMAYREGNDDILLLHLDAPERVSVVHLTWSRRQEFPNFPKVEFTGTFQAFVEREYHLYGLTADEDAGMHPAQENEWAVLATTTRSSTQPPKRLSSRQVPSARASPGSGWTTTAGTSR